MKAPLALTKRWQRLRAAFFAPAQKANTARLFWPGFDYYFQGMGAGGGERHPLTFSAVYQCVNLIADDVAKLPLKLYEVSPNGRRAEVFQHEVLERFRQPNSVQTRNDFVKDVMTHLLIRGNAYVYVRFDGRRRPVEMWPVHPDRAAPYIGADGSVFYDVSLTELESGEARGLHTRVPGRDLFHHRTFTPGHKLIGVPPMFAATLPTDIGQRIEAHTDAFYKNMARPSGVLQTEGTLTDDVIERLRAQFAERYSGENVGKPLVLEGGTSYKSVTMTASDAQQLETLKWTIEDVARAFRVPMFMLGSLSGVTYQNAEQLQAFYYQQCLQPHIEALESRLDLFFGLGPRLRAQFDLNALLRAETAARLDALGKGVQNAVYTPNEARAVEGLNPVAGGDQAYMQQQMRPLDKLGVEDVAATVPTPAPAAEPDDAEDAEDDDDEASESRQLPSPAAVQAAVTRAVSRRLLH